MRTNNEIMKATSIFEAKYSRMDQVKTIETAFKKIEMIRSASADHITSNFLKAVFHKFYITSFVITSVIDCYLERENCFETLYKNIPATLK